MTTLPIIQIKSYINWHWVIAKDTAVIAVQWWMDLYNDVKTRYWFIKVLLLSKSTTFTLPSKLGGEGGGEEGTVSLSWSSWVFQKLIPWYLLYSQTICASCLHNIQQKGFNLHEKSLSGINSRVVVMHSIEDNLRWAAAKRVWYELSYICFTYNYFTSLCDV